MPAIYVIGAGGESMSAAGGPPVGRPDRGGHTVDPTPPGDYILGPRIHVVAPSWPTSVIPWGAALRFNAANEVEYKKSAGAWTVATGASGVFAAGDVTYGAKTIIHAAAHGRLAARSIHAYLRKLSPRTVTEMPEDEFETHSTLPPDSTIHLDLRPIAREEMPLRGEEASRDRSLEFATGFTEVQARREASRCLRCDLAYLCPTINVIKPEMLVKK